MHSTLASIVLAAATFHQAGAAPRPEPQGFEQGDALGVVPVTNMLKSAHPDVVDIIQNTPFLNALSYVGKVKREDPVPVDGQPDPNRQVVTPQNVYVLQCSEPGFRGNCLVFGGAPGKCVNYSDFSKDPSFLNMYDNQTSSISTNTGGNCQFYKFSGCDDHGDDRGVTIGYQYNLGVPSNGYGGDYDDQISSWRC